MNKIIISFILSILFSFSLYSEETKEKKIPWYEDVRPLIPKGATEIEEDYPQMRFQGDGQHYLKAKMSLKDFEVFAKRLMISQKIDPRGDKQWLMASDGNDNPKWWDLSDKPEVCYLESDYGIEYVRFIQYENGYAYYCSVCW